ncbi:hypothetical protein [Metallibacterium scheffleri]
MAVLPLPSFSVKEIFELWRKGSNLEAEEKILELRSVAIALKEENLRLSEENQALQRRNSISSKLEFKEHVYWLDGEGPYCQVCYDRDDKLVRLHVGVRQGLYPHEKRDRWECRVCRQSFDMVATNSS